MTIEFNGEDLMMVVLPELKTLSDMELQFTRINKLRNKLRRLNIAYDLGQNDFETLRYEFPENVSIRQTEICIKNTNQFVKYFELRVERQYKFKYAEICELWMETR